MRTTMEFRFWDKQAKKFVDGNLISINGNGRISYAHGNPVGGDGMNGERFIVQRFTGLLDKNKKKIYEGDIVGSFSNTQNSEVFWENDGGFWAIYLYFSSHPDSQPEMELLSNHLGAISVIGNVCENGDLVKDF